MMRPLQKKYFQQTVKSSYADYQQVSLLKFVMEVVLQRSYYMK